MIAGVCSGIAQYLDVDPTIIRLLFVLFAFMGGGGLWIYLVLWFIMPEKPVVMPESAALKDPAAVSEKKKESKAAPFAIPAEKKAPARKSAAKATKTPIKTTAKRTETATRKKSTTPKSESALKEDAEDKKE